MKQNGFTSVIFLMVIAALVGVAGYLAFTREASAPTVPATDSTPIATTTPETKTLPSPAVIPTAQLLQDCPETWYDNRMPMIIDPGQPRPVTQYFIYKGERRELAEFDMQWVSQNCSVQPSAVY